MQRKAERMKSLHEWTVLGVADAAAFPLLEAGGSVTELFGATEGGPTGAGAKSPVSPRELCVASYSMRTGSGAHGSGAHGGRRQGLEAAGAAARGGGVAQDPALRRGRRVAVRQEERLRRVFL